MGDQVLFYPASTYNFQVMADHLPAPLNLERGREETRRAVRRLKSDQMSEGEWADKENEMKEFLARKTEVIQKASNQKATT